MDTALAAYQLHVGDVIVIGRGQPRTVSSVRLEYRDGQCVANIAYAGTCDRYVTAADTTVTRINSSKDRA